MDSRLLRMIRLGKGHGLHGMSSQAPALGSPAMINLQNLLDDVKCDETVRQLRWPDGVRCPHCGATTVTKQGRDTTQPARQQDRCEACHRYFDDLTGTVLAGHHQPLRVWI